MKAASNKSTCATTLIQRPNAMLIRWHAVSPRQYLPPLSNYNGQIRHNGTRVFEIKVAADWGPGVETDVGSEGRRPDCGRDTLWVPPRRGAAAAPAGVVGGFIVCDWCTAAGGLMKNPLLFYTSFTSFSAH